MSEQQDQAAQTAPTPAFNLQRVYLKDLSVEMPNAPQTFLEQEAPTVSINVGVGGQRLAESVFEVTITVTVTTKIEKKWFTWLKQHKVAYLNWPTCHQIKLIRF